MYKLFALVFLFMCSCTSSKNAVTQEQLNTFESLIASQNYSIISDFAYPQTTNATIQVLNSGILAPGNNASAIDLMGTSNFLRIKNDSVFSYLPFFGERRFAIEYGRNNGAIEMHGAISNYNVKAGKNNSKIISFTANTEGNIENFNVSITVYPNFKSELYVNGAARTFIRYDGLLTPTAQKPPL